MVKVMLFVQRKEGLSREEFAARYESGHVPLVLSVLPLLRKYTRNYVDEAPWGFEPDFDAITEFWFDSAEDMEATKKWAQTEEGQVLARDEEVFMNRSSMRVLLVEEEASPAR